jgi:hypothetical protein
LASPRGRHRVTLARKPLRPAALGPTQVLPIAAGTLRGRRGRRRRRWHWTPGAARRRLPVGWFRLDRSGKRGGRGGTEEWSGADAGPGRRARWMTCGSAAHGTGCQWRIRDSGHRGMRIGVFPPNRMDDRRFLPSVPGGLPGLNFFC